jgi:hypothetical protein
MPDPRKVLDQAIEEFETKARGWGKLEDLLNPATLAFEGGEAMRKGEEVPEDRAKSILHPGRSHPEHLDEPRGERRG